LHTFKNNPGSKKLARLEEAEITGNLAQEALVVKNDVEE
jgi:hypothetical protein